ncbi:type II secretory pathway pseudopilin PulG [Herbaspirillum sp. 1173]|uniref:hypothetical protein n=1 Tax=unclassified Herbaspirillum TaxID=2624150 RepID=UPI001AE1E8F6|nr:MULTISPECIES: hypothetical protein [unclassified Herbaspirillum]MBP1313186.1 type II secretory pathway pseudopilin PulG [Herbaspirillum sp. 1130]MDR6738422.1 type II secretory pathway pseudopilin PulG [Herbaspirillum sp. 1173]
MDAIEQQREEYARQLRLRFEQYKRWAIEHWPVAEQPLDDSAFIAAERELDLLTGTMLHPGRKPDGIPASGAQQTQFEDVTPAPWP